MISSYSRAVMSRVSEPADTPVICHVAVLVPTGRVPMLTVGVETLMCPLCDASVTDTPVKVL